MDQRLYGSLDSRRLILVVSIVQEEMGRLGVHHYCGLPFTVILYTDGWHLWAKRA